MAIEKMTLNDPLRNLPILNLLFLWSSQKMGTGPKISFPGAANYADLKKMVSEETEFVSKIYRLIVYE